MIEIIHLHSTMVLFKSNIRDIISISNEFTFHYGPIQILIHLFSLITYALIYIPLWSYSNLFGTLSSSYELLFTFHYGPIQMYSNIVIFLFNSPFTFHYGPIQIS